MSNQSKSRRETKGKTARNKARKTARGSAPNRRAPSGTTHVTPVGGNVFADLGFPPAEAAALLRESRKRIDAELAHRKQQHRKPKMSEREMQAALREMMAEAVPSLPAPPGTVPPARWLPVRQAAQWRREIERDRAAGKPLPDFRTEGVLTLRRFAEHEYAKTNDICLMDDLSIARFIGVAEDDNDFYYVCERLPAPRAESRRVYWSAVCECTSLRGRLDPKLYERIDATLTINGCRPVRRMLMQRETRAPIRPRSPANKKAKNG